MLFKMFSFAAVMTEAPIATLLVERAQKFLHNRGAHCSVRAACIAPTQHVMHTLPQEHLQSATTTASSKHKHQSWQLSAMTYIDTCRLLVAGRAMEEDNFEDGALLPWCLLLHLLQPQSTGVGAEILRRSALWDTLCPLLPVVWHLSALGVCGVLLWLQVSSLGGPSAHQQDPQADP